MSVNPITTEGVFDYQMRREVNRAILEGHSTIPHYSSTDDIEAVADGAGIGEVGGSVYIRLSDGTLVAIGGASTLASPFSLGGSDQASVSMDTPPAYTAVLEAHYFYAPGSFTGVVRAWLWARTGGVGVRARLYDMTASAAVGTSALVTATARPSAPDAFAVTITAGHFYRLDIISDTNAESAFGIGDLYAS